MERVEALALLRQHTKNENLVKHHLAAEAVMRALAIDLGHEEEIELWGLSGLLHDIDWEETQPDMNLHSRVAARWLRDSGIDEVVVRAIEAHNPAHEMELVSDMEKALFCAEELTGLIVASTLVLQSKKISDLSADSVERRFKEKSFAKGVSREITQTWEEFFNRPVRDLIEIELRALQEIADDLGL